MANTSAKYGNSEHKLGVLDALADYFGGRMPYKRKGRPVGIAGQNKRSTRRPVRSNNNDRGLYGL